LNGSKGKTLAEKRKKPVANVQKWGNRKRATYGSAAKVKKCQHRKSPFLPWEKAAGKGKRIGV